jgi:hypothetical protein
MALFDDAPKNIDDIFIGCQYDLFRGWGHPKSPKTIELDMYRDIDPNQ